MGMRTLSMVRLIPGMSGGEVLEPARTLSIILYNSRQSSRQDAC